MNLEDQIKPKMIEAMKAKNTIALEALRAIKSELLLIKTSGVSEELNEKQEVVLLQKLVKQRKEAAEQFKQHGKAELEEKELAQAEVIQSFLPAQLTENELVDIIKKIITQVGATSTKDMGKVMGVATSQLVGKVEGRLISEVTKKLLH